jgi:dethiobiotin synthetase
LNAVFITGTDTGVGKTVVAGLLGRYLLDKGLRAITQKWVQTGGTADIDVHLKLMDRTKKDIIKYLPYMMPYRFKFAASAHLAARLENKRIEPAKIKNSFRLLAKEFDFVIVEGLGGALVPYNGRKLLTDIVGELGLAVVIVAENKLGAINHTLLTAEAIKSRAMKIAGIVFNTRSRRENKIVLEDNPRIIKLLTAERIAGVLPWSKNNKLLHRAFAPIGDKICAGLRVER